MARLHVVAVANKLPAWAEAARDEFLKRMPRGYEVRLVQLKPSAAGKLRKEIPAGTRLVALDERGKDLTTKQFAALLLRLSALTLPHALAQVVLCEQIYRAATLLTGHPYHRE